MTIPFILDFITCYIMQRTNAVYHIIDVLGNFYRKVDTKELIMIVPGVNIIRCFLIWLGRCAKMMETSLL